MNEIWLPVNYLIFNESHLVSNIGRVKTIKGRILSQNYDKYGYLRTCLNYKGFEKTVTVHKLVALTFLHEYYREGYVVNHKNGIKTDNRVENLEWCTTQYNTEHAKQLGLIKSGFEHPTSKSFILYDNKGFVISQYLTVKDFEDCSGFNRTSFIEFRERGALNIKFIDRISSNMITNLPLNKSKSNLTNPIKVMNEYYNTLAIYSNGSILEQCTTISRRVVSKVGYLYPYKYKKREGGNKNPILYLQRIPICEFLTSTNCIVDDYFKIY